MGRSRGAMGTGTGEDSFDDAPVAPGDVLASKYRVERVLGVGGMGVVVAARHLELETPVALKFLLPRAAGRAELVQRFLKEARATVRLKSVHVAKTLDVGRLDDGRPYLVMEYLDGRDLCDELHVRGHALPVEEAVSYVLQACDGIAEAHALGIVHRDLKPANLFLTRGADGRPLVKVLDFGISKSIEPSPESMSLTKTDAVLGSPFYMSPEQLRASRDVDGRADVWALGAITYELLAGRVPFQADSIMDLCLKVAQEPPPSLRARRTDVPEELERVVMRCLAKEPGERFANVGELAAALAPFAAGDGHALAKHAAEVIASSSLPSLRPPSESTTGPRVKVTPVSGPAAAWGTTQAQLPSSNRRWWLVAVAAASVTAGAAFTLVRARPTAPTAAATSTATPSPTSTSATAFGGSLAPPSASAATSTSTATADPIPAPIASAPAAAKREHARPRHETTKAAPAIATPTAPTATASSTVAKPAPKADEFIPVRE